MSHSSTPTPASRGSTPASHTSATPAPLPSTHTKAKPKATNVFSDDGSFLERIQRSKMVEVESQKLKEESVKKISFEDRFRGKRRMPEDDESSTVNTEDPPSKKVRSDGELTEYQKEVKSYSGSLKDTGTGIRPLVK
ncbi:hypothetical protein BD410DRAFT_539695 [Rickenella mellea]|uniref:Uncharacterized protein n=1 Tax=Rickenella mellea TaxID=50990 RepID=A0A4Y7PT52_9AGAM|nr:hypothetical protein BD410DRAFT_539695 [Rickenella mellea]